MSNQNSEVKRKLLSPNVTGRRTRLEIIADVLEMITIDRRYTLQEHINILEATKAILILQHDEKSGLFLSGV